MLFLLVLFNIINSIVFNRIYPVSSISSFHVILDVRKRIELIDSNQTVSIINSKSRNEFNNTVLSQPTQELKEVQSVTTINQNPSTIGSFIYKQLHTRMLERKRLNSFLGMMESIMMRCVIRF